jgi:hypothetical protein
MYLLERIFFLRENLFHFHINNKLFINMYLLQIKKMYTFTKHEQFKKLINFTVIFKINNYYPVKKKLNFYRIPYIINA